MRGAAVLRPAPEAGDVIDTASQRSAMVERLVADGILVGSGWMTAFNKVPRELFVPRFYRRGGEFGPWELIDGADADRRDEWLRCVYDQDQTMVTQVDPTTGAPTSSSTMPRIVAAMLEALDVARGHRVLEIGTGTGYNTALLCERLGSANVTSVDIDEELVQLARQRLLAAGHTPCVVAADGFNGHPERAPYDRIMATCQVRAVPSSWVRQTRPGGRILAVLSDGMVFLTVDEAGAASGRFHSFPVGFMWMRGPGHSPARLPAHELSELTWQEADRRRPRVDVMEVMRGKRITSLWPIALTTSMPFYARVPAPPGRVAFADMADRSWVVVCLDGSEVPQGGPRRLWDAIEDLYELLERNGGPERERFGLTVRPDGSQFVWLDEPDSRHRWEIG